mmetsp:Transcript_2862/g.8235  ORF Transcript_2862/g.8235 Transcript_2862/m.8235 type:complete len:485 (-) Transcript_2862:143-1597(-)
MRIPALRGAVCVAALCRCRAASGAGVADWVADGLEPTAPSQATAAEPGAEAADASQAVDAMQAVDAVRSADAVQVAGAVRMADAVQAPDAVQTPDAAQVVDVVQAANAAKAADIDQAPKAVQAPDAVQTPDSVQAVDTMQAVDAVHAADAVQAADAVRVADADVNGTGSWPCPSGNLRGSRSGCQNATAVAEHAQVLSSFVECSSEVIGFPASAEEKAIGRWCAVHVPPYSWNLKQCPASCSPIAIDVSVLTYNLYWWNLFDLRHGAGRSAGRLIARAGGSEGFDFMGFQECDDRWRVLRDAQAEGLRGDYEAIDGGRALAIVYSRSKWQILDQGAEDVGEDAPSQYYGRRAAHWVRAQHRWTGKTVFFMNHHGPLPVSFDGGCTGAATAINILRVVASHAHKRDTIILVGDFNAGAQSSRIRELDHRLTRVFSGRELGGVDHIYSNCGRAEGGARGLVATRNLGKGAGEFGSDHDALAATFRL